MLEMIGVVVLFACWCVVVVSGWMYLTTEDRIIKRQYFFTSLHAFIGMSILLILIRI